MKLDRRSSDRIPPQPPLCMIPIKQERTPIIPFILFICILIAAIINFKDVVSSSLYHENITYSSNPPEIENIFARKQETGGYWKENNLEVNYGEKILCVNKRHPIT